MSTSVAVEPGSITSRYEALVRATAALAECHDCASFQSRFREVLRELVPYDHLSGIVFERDSQSEIEYLFDPLVADDGAELSLEQTTSGWVRRQQQRLYVEDWNRETRFPAERELLRKRGIVATCTFPLTTPHRQIGTLTVGSGQREGFSDTDLSLLTLLVSHVSLGIDDAINFDATQSMQAELKRRNEQLELVLDLTNQVVSNLELRDVMRAVAGSVRRAMESDGVAVMLPAPEATHLEVFALDAPDAPSKFVENAQVPLESMPGQVFRTGTPTVCSLQELAANDPEKFRGASLAGLKFFGYVPLVSRERVVGVLGLARKSDRPFAPEEVAFLMKLAGQVAIAVENALAFREIAELRDKLAQEKLYLEDEIRGSFDIEGIVGQSSALRHVLQMVETVAPSDSTVLLLGETGTGKEGIARAIHDRSRRNGRTFVKLNCAAIPTGLLESELFGHERGAFTGAIAQRIGRLEFADQGTLFLDEIGDIPLELQPKLLRALQEREFERLGSTQTKKVNVRLVAATNRNLEKMIADGQFRTDLFYRLNVFPIRIPPLRERPGDIPLLVRYFTQKYARQMEKKIDSVPAAALKKLERWHWPGNIRELENFVERAVILTRGSVLQIPAGELGDEAVAPEGNGHEAASERDRILAVLKDTNGRVGGDAGAAARLGLKRTTLISRMKKLGIDQRPRL